MNDKEFQDFLVKQFDQLNTRLDTINNHMGKVDSNQLLMENEIIEKVRGLYDFREVQNDINEKVINTLDRIEAKIDVLQLETAHIRRVK